MRFIFALAALVLAALVLVAPLAAQPAVPLAIDYAVTGTTAYDTSIPTPRQTLGYTIGERHTRPEEVVRYVEAVAAASPRVQVGFHGETYEGRRLIHAVVSTPENLARLDAIRQQNARLSDAPESVTDAELAQMPAIVFQAYSVHGNEASGTEAALVYLYHLAAGQGAVERQLRDVVVVLVPMLNPDGRDRFADWVNGWRGGAPVADGQDAEHNEPWPGGRTNHYLFDLNRDWLTTELAESQGRMALWHSWRPQLTTDHHEMGAEATFFFQPGIPSRNNPNTPAATVDLTGQIAEYHAGELDRIGSLYYSGESFDDFYYGKGSTFPDVNGGVGILFEQASSRALRRDTDENGRLDYAFTVRNQVATSISTLEAAGALRERLLRHQRDFYRSADEVRQPAAYVVDLTRDRTRGQAMAQALSRARIRVHALAAPLRAGGRTFGPGEALVIPAAQPQARLLKASMERVRTFEDSLFYDVSAWTLPLAYGADVTEVDRLDRGALGPQTDAAFDGGRLVGGRADYAYLLRWNRYFAPRALRRLLDAGARVRLATNPFTAPVAGRETAFERGTLVVTVRQPDLPADSVHAIVERAVRDDFVDVAAVATGLTPTGNDLGSRAWPVLRAPRVALLAGPGTNSNGVGEQWFLLSERFGQPVSLLDTDALARADLSRYTVLLMADGSYGLGDAQKEALSAWVRAGGTLVATEGGARWAARAGLLGAETRPTPTDSTARPYAEREDARGAQQIGGSIFEVALDPTHPLAFGYGDRVAVFKADAQLFEPASADRGVDVGTFTQEPILSGYISRENLKRWPGAVALKAGRAGRGRVVLMDFDPAFRAFWRGTDGLLLNAVYFGGAF